MRAKRFRILVVDDEPDIVDAVAATLSADHIVLTALDGTEAIEVAARGHPDVILLDLNMPGLDGHEVARLLRSQAETRDIPIIMLTAQSDEQTAVKGFEGGANDYLVKPFTPAHLRARVNTWLVRRQGLGAEA